MSHAPDIFIALYANSPLVFDPWMGFLGAAGVQISSKEVVTGDEPAAMIEYHSPALRYYGVNLGWAFAKGLLVIRDQASNSIPLHYDMSGEPGEADNQVHFLRGSQPNVYNLLCSRCSRLEHQMRKYLSPGTPYFLALGPQALIMQARFMESNTEHLQPGQGNHLVNVPCDSTQIPLSVFASAPIPRFTISLSASSASCKSSLVSEFTLDLTITSLHRRPVRIGLIDLRCLHKVLSDVKCFNPRYSLEPQNRERSIKNPDHTTNFELGNGSTRVICECCNSSSTIIFPHGGTFTSHWTLETLMSSLPIRTCNLSIQLETKVWQILEWNYVNTHEDCDADDRKRWESKGYIDLEPVYHGWDKVEKILESERPMPFFKLPRELRDVVYECAKFANGVENIQFTFEQDESSEQPSKD